MKLFVLRHGAARCHVAALRNALSCQAVPFDCPIRKCRRDGFCSGPLVCRDRDRMRLVRGDCGDLAPAGEAVPVCYLALPDDIRQAVLAAVRSDIRTLHAAYGAWTIETTRVIAARRWRRLDMAGPETEEPIAENPPVIPAALC